MYFGVHISGLIQKQSGFLVNTVILNKASHKYWCQPMSRHAQQHIVPLIWKHAYVCTYVHNIGKYTCFNFAYVSWLLLLLPPTGLLLMTDIYEVIRCSAVACLAFQAYVYTYYVCVYVLMSL